MTDEPKEHTTSEIVSFWIMCALFVLMICGMMYSIPWLVNQRNDGELLLAFIVTVSMPVACWVFYEKIIIPFLEK